MVGEGGARRLDGEAKRRREHGARGTERGEGRGVGKVLPVAEGRGRGAPGHRCGCGRVGAEGGPRLGEAACWKQV